MERTLDVSCYGDRSVTNNDMKPAGFKTNIPYSPLAPLHRSLSVLGKCDIERLNERRN